MSMTRSMLHMAARENRSPKDTIIEVNNCLAPDMNPGMFVTLAYLVLDTRSREVRLVRAGHNAPLLYSSHHGQVIDLHPKGIAIGLDREGPLFASQLEPQKFTLQPGDVLVLYTDGIVEGKDPQGRDFGDERLHQLLLENRERPASELLEIIMAELRSHQKNAEQSDDITLLVLKSC
jgi:sigma-B regulation protein RsbU (phosphoserine phosphatase)